MSTQLDSVLRKDKTHDRIICFPVWAHWNDDLLNQVIFSVAVNRLNTQLSKTGFLLTNNHIFLRTSHENLVIMDILGCLFEQLSNSQWPRNSLSGNSVYCFITVSAWSNESVHVAIRRSGFDSIQEWKTGYIRYLKFSDHLTISK